MAWIESHQELGRHPKTKRLARKLNITLPQAVGHLFYLWWWAMDFAQDGCLSDYDVLDIAEEALYSGDPADFLDALIENRFIDRAEDGTLFLHDWDDYGGRLLEQREQNKARCRRARESKRAIENDENISERETNAFATRSEHETNRATVHNSTEHNRTRQKEDQERLTRTGAREADAKSGNGESARRENHGNPQNRDNGRNPATHYSTQQQGETAETPNDRDNAGNSPKHSASGKTAETLKAMGQQRKPGNTQHAETTADTQSGFETHSGENAGNPAKQGNKPKQGTAMDERFDTFWKAYPLKRGKLAAQKAFCRIKPDAALLDAMLTAIAKARKSAQWQRENGRYIPNPSTWLNQGRWDDEPPETDAAAPQDEHATNNQFLKLLQQGGIPG